MRFSLALGTVGIGLVSLYLAAPALAHHSYAMFERDKSMTLTGTVRTWQFINPHSSLWVYVPRNDEKKYDLWGLEGGSVSQLERAGWSRDAVKPGDKITVTFRPLKDGRTGGSLLRVVLADGRALTVDDQQATKPSEVR